MKIARLRGRKVCERVMKRGEVWRGKHMKITYLRADSRFQTSDIRPQIPSPKSQVLYAGTIASTKLEKSAVKRNRMRRRCREALRITTKETSQLPIVNSSRLPVEARPRRDWRPAPQSDCQLLIVPRLSSLTCDFEELLHDAQNFLSYLLKH